MTMTKQALIDTITQELGANGTPISKTQVDAVLVRYSVVAARTLSEGGDVPLPGLGKLKASHRAARTDRNPSTGETIEIAAKYGAKLVPAKALLDALN